MKKLLTKTLRIFTFYSLIVLAASIPVYYYLVDYIWLQELDENNEIIADKTENEISKANIRIEELDKIIGLWNKIQPGTNLEKARFTVKRTDSTYTILRRNPYVQNNELKRFRGLSRFILIKDRPYILTVETNVEETEETIVAISIVTFLFFLLLIIGFLIIINGFRVIYGNLFMIHYTSSNLTI